MKLSKITWLLLIITIFFGGFVYYYEFHSKSEREKVQNQKDQVFNFTEDEIKALGIRYQTLNLKLERSDKEKSQWKLIEPQQMGANDAVVSFLINLLIERKPERTFLVSPDELSNYGFDNSSASIEIELSDQTQHQILLGGLDFTEEFIYARIDPQSNTDKIEVSLLSKDFLYAIERDLSEWKQEETPSVDP